LSGLLDVEVAYQVANCNIWHTGAFRTFEKSIQDSIPAYDFSNDM